MKARVRFLTQPFFTSLPNKLTCPGMLVGRSENRVMWTMIFTALKQVSVTIFEGDLRWVQEPSEQDFGKGVKFKLMSRPGSKRRLDGVEHDSVDRPDHESPNDGRPHPTKEKNRTARLRAEANVDASKGKPTKPPGGDLLLDHGHSKSHDPDDEVNHNLPLVRFRNFGTRPPVPGVFAEGELLG